VTVVAPAPRGSLSAWSWFAVWAAVGCACAFGLVSFIAPALALAVLVAVALLVWRRHDLEPAVGLTCGVGALLLLVAWLQRKGPGTVAWHTATASGWDTYLDPRPFLAAGLMLLAIGIVTFAFLRRRVHH
jgi:hypothetical protein